MSFSLASLHLCFVTAALTLSSLLVCSGQTRGGERGWPIEFSSPRGEETNNALNELPSRREGLKQLEDDLYRPVQSFSPQSSLDGVAVRPAGPPAGPVIQNKRVKELLERRKSWVFTISEDVMKGPTGEEVLKAPQYGPDGQEKKETPAFERFYQRLADKRSGAENLRASQSDAQFGSPAKENQRDELAATEDSDLPGNLKESAEALRKQFEPGSKDSPFNPFVQIAAHGDLVDTFGLAAKNPFSKEQMQDQQKFMDEYHSLLDPSWHPPAAATPSIPFSTVTSAGLPAWKPATGLSSSPSLTPSKGFDLPLDVVNPVLGPPGLPDLNAQALGQASPTMALPKAETTRVAPIAPSFAVPTRAFR